MSVRIPLAWKLLALHVVVVTCVLLALWLAIRNFAVGAFMELMNKYQVDPSDVEGMFLSSTRDTLWQVGAVALVVAALLCWVLTRRLLRPLPPMAAAARRIASGDYAARVAGEYGSAVYGNDELGRLARSFDQMAEGLERMETLRKRMIVDVAHELRTPLTNLRGTVEAMQDGLMEPDAQTLTALHDELLRLARLTDDLCDAARSELARDQQLVDHDLRALIDSVAQLFAARLEQRGIRLRVALDQLPATVPLDADSIRQVVGNLLQNALQFTSDGEWIEIEGMQRPALVRVIVANPGTGIADRDLPWIFEPYYRADTSRSRDTGGAGVGLAIVKSRIEAHGGAVGASSTPDATRVWFELPTERRDGAVDS